MLTQPGTYTVTLTVKDAAGNVATDAAKNLVEAAQVVVSWWILGVVVSVASVMITAIALISGVYFGKLRKPS